MFARFLTGDEFKRIVCTPLGRHILKDNRANVPLGNRSHHKWIRFPIQHHGIMLVHSISLDTLGHTQNESEMFLSVQWGGKIAVDATKNIS